MDLMNCSMSSLVTSRKSLPGRFDIKSRVVKYLACLARLRPLSIRRSWNLRIVFLFSSQMAELGNVFQNSLQHSWVIMYFVRWTHSNHILLLGIIGYGRVVMPLGRCDCMSAPR